MDSSKLTRKAQMDLFEKVIVGQLSEPDRRRLEAALKDSDEMRSSFRNYVWLHMELASAARMARARQAVYDEVRDRAAEVKQSTRCSSRSTVEPPLSTMQGSRRNSLRVATNVTVSRRVWVCLSAMAVAVAILIGLTLLPHANDAGDLVDGNYARSMVDVVPAVAIIKPPAPVATYACYQTAIWQGEARPPKGVLREGESIELSSGEIQLSVGFGAEILARGPSSLTFISPGSVRLNYGDIAVQVAEWAKGFTVLTSAMDVVDLGTTFTVSASPGNGVETRVLKGLVRVHPHESDSQARRGLLVSEGGAYLVDEQGNRWRGPQSDSSANEEINFSRFSPYHPVELHNTGLGIDVGDEDPYWRVAAGPEGFEWPQFASVCSGSDLYPYLPNDSRSSQWVSVASWRRAKARSVFTFQTSCNLSGYDLSTIQFFGRFLADNGVREVRVNGRPVELESWVDLHKFGHEQFRFVNVSDGLVADENVIEIDVWNGNYEYESSSYTPNPMALRVEWYAFGRQLDSTTERTEQLGSATY